MEGQSADTDHGSVVIESEALPCKSAPRVRALGLTGSTSLLECFFKKPGKGEYAVKGMLGSHFFLRVRIIVHNVY